jgi:hypothetical protein
MTTGGLESRFVHESYSSDAGTKHPLERLLAQQQRGQLRKDKMMKMLGLAAALAASVAATGCATYPNQYGYNPYYGNGYYNNGYYDNGYYDDRGRRVATGAAVGALGGAAVGAVVPGVSPVGGAVAGAILGGVIGASANGHQYYRDTRGYCYYVDQYGQPHYSYDVRC